MNRNTSLVGHLACFGAYFIFGLNIVFCKDIANAKVVSPSELFCLRAIGATTLFWLVSLFVPREKVSIKDLLRIFLASMLGLLVTQLSFLKAITMTTSIDSSILSSAAPIMTMFIAAFFLKEPITFKKVGGVLMSFMGVMLLIYNSASLGSGVEHTSPMGVVLMLCNGLSFALYLGIFRPLISKYNVITFMKWMFLFSMLVSFPFSLKNVIEIPYSEIQPKILLQIGYLILFATFVAYFLIPIGQKYLRPTIVSMYSYMQPIIAMVLSIIIGMDHLSWQKILAAILVFSGVAVVTQSKAAKHNIPSSAKNS